MKITRRQLRRLITEEMNRILLEQAPPPDPAEIAGIIQDIVAVLQENPELAGKATQAGIAAAQKCAMGILTGQDPVECANREMLQFISDNSVEILMILASHPELMESMQRLAEIAEGMGVPFPELP